MSLFDMPTPEEIDEWPLEDVDVSESDPRGVIGLVASANFVDEGIEEDDDFNPYDEDNDLVDETLYWVSGDVRDVMRNLRHRLIKGEEIDTILFGVKVKITPSE